MILHLVSRSPFESAAFEQCLELATPQDSIVLLSDGVLAANHPKIAPWKLGNLFAMMDDLTLRGIRLSPNSPIKPLTMTELVELTVTYPSSHTWF